MNGDYADRILEAGLEEVIGGRYPPDLTSKILQTWEARQHATGCAGQAAQDDARVDSPLPIGPPIHAPSEPTAPPQYGAYPGRPGADRPDHLAADVQAAPDWPRPSRRARQRPRRRWLAATLAASVMALAGLLGLYAKVYHRPSAGRVIGRTSPADASDAQARLDTPRTSPARGTPRPDLRADDASPPASTPALPAFTWLPAIDQPERIASAASKDQPPSAAQARRHSTDREIVAFIDHELRQRWDEHSVTPSPRASDEQWCERTYRRLVGRGPTDSELKAFVRPQKRIPPDRQALVDQLLASDEHARHWAELWSEALVGAASDDTADGAFSRADLVRYLTDAAQADRPQDQIVLDLLSARGASRAGEADYNGAVNFLLAGAADDARVATDRTARVFLGKQLVCTSCHEQPTAAMAVGEFWKLNAFFRQLAVRTDPTSGQTVLIDQDFPGASGAAKDAELFYRLPDGRLGMAYPELDGRAISHSGLVGDVHRRAELATLIVASNDFPRATVNRVWSWLFGYGMTRPVDDLGPHNPPSHPELLDRLAAEFAGHDFHVKELIRWIVLSEPFGLSSKRTAESWMDDPESGGQPLFARYYAPVANAGDVARMLVSAVHQRPVPSSNVAGTLARRAWMQPGSQPLQIIEPRAEAAWIGPAWLAPLARSNLPPEEKISHVFLSILARRPNPRELTAAKLVFADRLGDPSAIREIWRTLVAARSSPADGD